MYLQPPQEGISNVFGGDAVQWISDGTLNSSHQIFLGSDSLLSLRYMLPKNKKKKKIYKNWVILIRGGHFDLWWFVICAWTIRHGLSLPWAEFDPIRIVHTQIRPNSNMGRRPEPNLIFQNPSPVRILIYCKIRKKNTGLNRLTLFLPNLNLNWGHTGGPEFDLNPDFSNPYLKIRVLFGFRSTGRIVFAGYNSYGLYSDQIWALYWLHFFFFSSSLNCAIIMTILRGPIILMRLTGTMEFMTPYLRAPVFKWTHE